MLTFDGGGGATSAASRPRWRPDRGGGQYVGQLSIRFDRLCWRQERRGSDPAVARAAATRADGKASRARLCIRSRRHAKPHCINLRRIALPPVAQLTEPGRKAGESSIHIPLTRLGRMLLIAGRAANAEYRHRHPHGKRPPTLRLKLTLSLTPSD